MARLARRLRRAAGGRGLAGIVRPTPNRRRRDAAIPVSYTHLASQCARIDYPKPDGKLTFDKLSSVFISNTNHDENEPIHLTLKDASVPVKVNLAKYGGPESRYCPCLLYTSIWAATS